MRHQPNILLIMTDQHRFDVLGCMGNEYVDTPNLDRDPNELADMAASPEHASLLETMRNRLIEELEPRDCGLVRNGRLVVQKHPVCSPHYKARLNGMTRTEKEMVNERMLDS